MNAQNIGVTYSIKYNYLPNFINSETFVLNMTNFLPKINSTVSGPTIISKCKSDLLQTSFDNVDVNR